MYLEPLIASHPPWLLFSSFWKLCYNEQNLKITDALSLSLSNDQKESNKKASRLIKGRFSTPMRILLRPIILSTLYFRQKVPLLQEMLIKVVLFLFTWSLGQGHLQYTSSIYYSKIKAIVLAKKRELRHWGCENKNNFVTVSFRIQAHMRTSEKQGKVATMSYQMHAGLYYHNN